MFYVSIYFSNTAQNSSKLHLILRTPELSVKTEQGFCYREQVSESRLDVLSSGYNWWQLNISPAQGKQDMGQMNNEAEGLYTSGAMDIKKEFYFKGIQLCSVWYKCRILLQAQSF